MIANLFGQAASAFQDYMTSIYLKGKPPLTQDYYRFGFGMGIAGLQLASDAYSLVTTALINLILYADAPP